ncbi:hypothetical protein HK096_003826, partial [Nowakowskiella sp. JEL0078]
MQSWQPDESLANQLAQQLLLLVTDVQDKERQKIHMQNITNFNNHPDASNYYAYILACLESNDANLTYIREIAGTQLRNLIKRHFAKSEFHMSAEHLQYAKLCGFHALRDSNKKIRESAGNVLAAFAASQDADRQVLQKILELSNSPATDIAESAMKSLYEFCDEGHVNLCNQSNFPVLDVLLVELFLRIDHSSSKVRMYAIRSINPFIFNQPEPLMDRLDLFIEKLSQFSQDSDSNVRKVICEALVLVLDTGAQRMAPQLNPIVEYILKAMNDEDEDVALEACEFWSVFADREENATLLRPYLKFVVPILLEKMIYSEEEISILDGEDEDVNKPDADKDVLVKGYRSRNISHQSSVDPNQDGANPEEEKLDDYDDDDDDDDDDEEDYSEQMWTIRKCAAGALDAFSTLYKDELLADQLVFLAPLSRLLANNSDWKHQECGILALGAVAEGCRLSMSMHLGSLIPFLVQNLNENSKRLVKIITCWTLGRYSWWLSRPIASKTDPAYSSIREKHHIDFLHPVVSGLLNTMLNSSKHVQKAGCSALASLETEATTELVPYLTPILQTIGRAFEKYQRKNTLLLFDTVETLADGVKQQLGNPEHMELLMIPLIRKWQMTKDNDLDICISAVSHAIGTPFGPYLPPIWQRCLNIIEKTIMQFESDPSLPPESDEKDPMIVALDLLCSVSQDLPEFVNLLLNENPNQLFQLLFRSMQDKKLEVRQSAFALLGDLASSMFDHLKPHIGTLLPYAIVELEAIHISNNQQQFSVTNNAAWAVGEISLKA